METQQIEVAAKGRSEAVQKFLASVKNLAKALAEAYPDRCSVSLPDSIRFQHSGDDKYKFTYSIRRFGLDSTYVLSEISCDSNEDHINIEVFTKLFTAEWAEKVASEIKGERDSLSRAATNLERLASTV